MHACMQGIVSLEKYVIFYSINKEQKYLSINEGSWVAHNTVLKDIISAPQKRLFGAKSYWQ